MKVHGNDMVAPCDYQHVGDELRSYGRARLVLLVHTGIGEAGDDGGDPARGGGLAGGDEDEELHEVVVYVITARLDDEDVLVADALGDLDVDFAVGELFDSDGNEGDVKPVWATLLLCAMSATLREAAHRSATAWASSGWLLPVGYVFIG